jgi:RNA polymerase sigma-70 factor (ECF subfamily)
MPRDDDVIARAKAGEEEAWRELYLRHAHRLVALMRIVPTGDGAASEDDIAAYAWLQAAEHIADFSGTVDSFGGWLFSIARNRRARTRQRAMHSAAPIAVGSAQDLGESAYAGAVVEDQHLGEVADRLRVLPEKQRQVIALMDVLGYGVSDTAVALGMNATAVRVNRHRGLARLRSVTDQR